MCDKSDYSEEKYKTYFEIWMESYKLQFKRENIERSRPPLYLAPVGTKTSDGKTLSTDSLVRKEEAQKNYAP